MSGLKDFKESFCAVEGCGRSIWYTSEDDRGWFHWAWAMADHEAVPREGEVMSERETLQQKAKRLMKQGYTPNNIYRELGIDSETALRLLGEDKMYRQPSPEEDFPYRKAALSAAVEAWRDWFWTDGKPDPDTAAAEILVFAEKFLPWLRGEHPQEVLRGRRTQMTEEQYTPHSARAVDQFALEDRGGKKVFKGTGKLMCWCNCGEKTEWLDAYKEMDQVAAFFEQHEAAEEIGIKLSYSLGEMVGYRVDLEDGVNGARAYLAHDCGWGKELLIGADMLLTSIVLEAVQNKHTCKSEETR